MLGLRHGGVNTKTGTQKPAQPMASPWATFYDPVGSLPIGWRLGLLSLVKE